MDPNEFRETGHALVDRIGAYLEEVEEKTLFPDVTPAQLEKHIDELFETLRRECARAAARRG